MSKYYKIAKTKTKKEITKIIDKTVKELTFMTDGIPSDDEIYNKGYFQLQDAISLLLKANKNIKRSIS